jgi:voltage-gated potassium channel
VSSTSRGHRPEEGSPAKPTPKSLEQMPSSERRRAVLVVIARVVLVWILLIGAYFLFPVGHDWSSWPLVRLAVDMALLIAVIVWQLSRVIGAEYPQLRAMEALGVILVIFLVMFSTLYLSMSHSSRGTFTQPLDHMTAMYFTVTIFSTVGFGDITAKTDAARAVVTIQMILDLVLIGAVARLLLTAARSGIGRPADRTANP